MSELGRRRDELQQAIASGLGTMAQLVIVLSDTARRFAGTLEALAEKWEDEETSPTGPTMATGPTGGIDVPPPYGGGPEGPPVNP